MNGTLIKSNGVFDLLVDNTIYAQLPGGALSSLTKKLSIKNCQAIENGYDLDELAISCLNRDSHTVPHIWLSHIITFKQGFLKAMELMESKKYSEMDLMKAYKDGKTSMIKPHRLNMYEYEKSLQTKEWEVNIEVECCGNYSPCNINCEYGSKLKLDKDGCLILKRM